MKDSVIVLLVYIGIVIVLGILSIFKRKRCEFDEMQTINRASAYKRAYFTSNIILAGVIVYSVVEGKEMSPQMLTGLIMTSVVLSFLVFALHCVVHNSFFSLGKTSKAYCALCLVVGIIQGLNFVSTIKRWSAGTEAADNFLDYFMEFSLTSLLLAIAFITIAVAIAVKMFIDKKASEE